MSPAQRTLRLARTVRHLKPVQIYARVQGKLARVRPDGAPAPALRSAVGTWVPPVPRAASLVGGWRVRFLNLDGEIARPDQWNDPGKPKLWLYNLHYFDDLCAADANQRRDVHRDFVRRWIAENPPPLGNGWEPYPVSLRIVSWIKWHLAGAGLDAQMRDSLAMQARWLSAHVEWHLLGNHILANAKALVFAGLIFSGAEAESWLAAGLAIYQRELPEQILADGGHFELSPMYHAIILEDVLDLINVARLHGCESRGPLASLGATARRMRHWLAAMTHPDGGPSFFNDAAFGIAATRAELEDYARRLMLPPVGEPGEGVHHLAASGYIRVNRGDMAAILDVAAVGPDYIPGHAHADTLSFELSVRGERIIVNGGTSTYAPGPEREAQRATAAHSTVEIDGESSSEVWASFRVARRARITNLEIDRQDDCDVIRASHDGYRRLPGRNVHERVWRIERDRMSVEDRVSGPTRSATARFLLGPAARLDMGDRATEGRVSGADGRAIHFRSIHSAKPVAASWHPEFGKSVATHCIETGLVDGASHVAFEW